jgi:hypothetical protein
MLWYLEFLYAFLNTVGTPNSKSGVVERPETEQSILTLTYEFSMSNRTETSMQGRDREKRGLAE